MKTPLDRARAYLDKLPGAISGAGGHSQTFKAACCAVRLGLSDDDAAILLREYNHRCQPPWSAKELAHKLADARRVAGGQVRTYRHPAPSARVVWKVQRKTPPTPCPPPATPPPEPLAIAPPPPEPPPAAQPDRCVVRPGDRIPRGLLPVLATWKALRQHPAWQHVEWPTLGLGRPLHRV